MELPKLSLGQELDTIAMLLTLLPREKLQIQKDIRDLNTAQTSMRDSPLPMELPRLSHSHKPDITAMLITLCPNKLTPMDGKVSNIAQTSMKE
jgi:hypothetical protein